MDYNDIQQAIKNISSAQDLVDFFAFVHNKVGGISDAIYDYDEGSDEYKNTLEIVECWEAIEDELEDKIFQMAKKEHLLDERKPNTGSMKQIERFMSRYGYRDGSGWWIKNNK